MWKTNDNYLPNAFYAKKSTSSLSVLKHWIMHDPITVNGDDLTSYKQVELVSLAIGLTFQALWIAQFPNKYVDVPAYVIDSPFLFSEYDQLSHTTQDLIDGYEETLIYYRWDKPYNNTKIKRGR